MLHKMLIALLSLLALGLFAGCSSCSDEKVIDSGVNVRRDIIMVDDSTIMLELWYWERVEFYSSYIQGRDDEIRYIDSKFILINPWNGKEYREINPPSEDSKYSRDQVLDSSIFYFKQNDNDNTCLTKVGEWNYLKEAKVNFLIVDSTVIDSTDYLSLFRQNSFKNKRVLTTHDDVWNFEFSNRVFFLWNMDNNAYKKWIPTGESAWIRDCKDIQWTEKHFRCLMEKGDILLVDENQKVLDSLAKGTYQLNISSTYGLRFLGNYIGVRNHIYKMDESGEISDKPLFDIYFENNGVLFYTSSGDTIFYKRDSL